MPSAQPGTSETLQVRLRAQCPWLRLSMTLPLPPTAVEKPVSGGLDRLLPGSALALLALNAVLWWDGWHSASDLNVPALAVAGCSLLACLAALGVRRSERLARRMAARQTAAQQHVEQARHAERWAMAFDGASEALILCDAAGIAVQCNAAAVSLLGVPASSIVGQPIVAWLQIELPRAGGGTVGARLQRVDGEPIPVAVEVSQAADHGTAERLLRLRDLTDQRDVTQRLAALANFDSLTGLPNRELFRDRLGTAMARARRTGQPMALMFLDLDRFKVVNDSLGHAVGDDLLRHVSHSLSNCLRSVDVVARCTEDPVTISRLGGDEFTVIVEAIGGADDAAMIARRMLEALSAPFVAGEEELVISASIGISMYPTDDVDLDGLLRHTDMAMYRSKSLGRNTFSFFSDDLNTAVKARMSLEGSLRRAIERDEFVLYYQPKADLTTGKVVGVEALLRWDCPGKGMVPPDRFIAVLEDTGLILPVGAWVIRKALAELEQWDKLGLPPITMAVNLSARQLRHQYLTSLIEDSLLERRISPQRLELELTESLLMEDTEMNRLMLSNFARIGVRLAIDDFGTGHSSLSYLRRFRVDTLKIDRSFVGEIPHDSEDCAIATAIIALGRSMQIKLVAEGVETAEQAAFLRELGCDEMQGYLLTRPLPMPQLIEWFHEHERKLAHNELPMYAVEPDTIRGALLTMDGEPVTV
jgi:diguanylate cyclase (GGDEF)-like protein